MKKIILSFVALSCSYLLNAQVNYKIIGTVKDADVKIVYLGEQVSRDNFVIVDSVQIINGRFVLEGALSAVKPMSLKIGRSQALFLLDEIPIYAHYSLKEEDFRGKKLLHPSLVIDLTKDPDQRHFAAFTRAKAQEVYSMLAISFMGKDKDVNAPENEALADSISRIFRASRDYTRTVYDSIIHNYKDSYVAALILRDHLINECPVEKIQSCYEALSARVRASNIGMDLKRKLDQKFSLSIGQMAPDFTLPSSQGEFVSLSSFRGKIVLLDFWASWCAPCLREVPYVQETYAKFKHKGFEVLGVSLDNKREAWTATISKHRMSWTHVSSLEGWKCPAAIQYQVTGVPATFLIDREGKIIAINLRGKALKEMVASLLEE